MIYNIWLHFCFPYKFHNLIHSYYIQCVQTHSIIAQNKYVFNEDHIKKFNKILPLIQYDLKLNDIDVIIDYQYFLEYHNNKDINNANLVTKEKIISTLNFYNYLLNPIIIDVFVSIYEYILNKRPWVFTNSFLNSFFESFETKNLSILFYTNIVIKSLVNPSYYRKSFYETDSDELINAEQWVNSTTVLENQYTLINNFIVYNKINLEITDVSEKNKKKNKHNVCLSNLFKFINSLIVSGFIKEKTIKRNVGLGGGKKLKTLKYWSIIEDNDLYNLIVETNFSLIPYRLIKHFKITYEIGGHFSKVIVLCRKNWYSGEIFTLHDEKYINKILGLKLFINSNSISNVLNIIEKKEKIDLNNLENLISQNSIKLKTKFNEKVIDDKIKIEIKELQKITNKYIDLLRIKKLMILNDMDIPKYLPIFFDFRGRNYFDDYVSPTFSKIIRICFFYGYYSQEELESSNLDLIGCFVEKNIDIINNVLLHLNLKSEKYIINAVFWILISIGKHFVNNEKVKIPLEDFLKEGFDALIDTNKIEKLKIKNYIEVYHYIDIIKSLKNNEKIRKEIVLKDATASVLQNLIKILGPKDQEALNLANLGDTYNWYDPYAYILNKFKNSFEKTPEKIKYFNRSTIKKTIMTNPYSAGLKTCWNYFVKEVENSFDIKKEELPELYDLYENFYNFVTDFFEELHFFKNSSKKIIDYYIEIAKKENKIILMSDDSSVNFIYYIHKTHYIDMIDENGKRITKKIKKIDYSKINYKKIYTSIRANIAHWLDAIFLRKLVNDLKNPIFTIHDEFAIDFLSIDKLILSANEIARQNVLINIPWDYSHNFNIFSVFILV